MFSFRQSVGEGNGAARMAPGASEAAIRIDAQPNHRGYKNFIRSPSKSPLPRNPCSNKAAEKQDNSRVGDNFRGVHATHGVDKLGYVFDFPLEANFNGPG